MKSLTHVAAAPAGSLEELAAFLGLHDKVVLLTGAGMSTASGIPDYRDSDGVRRGKAPIQGPDFRRDEALRRRYWARSMVGYPTLSLAEPNAGHRAIAALEAQGRLAGLITQNVDGLHQRAGSGDVTELHGNIHRVACLACDARFARRAIQSLLVDANPAMLGSAAAALPDGDADLEPASLAGFRVPGCPHCGGMLQPDVVFFGDGVSRASTAAAEAKLAAADAVLVVGSSLVVFSGYRLCRMAADAGKPVIALNLGKTRADHLLTIKTEASAEHALPQLARLLGKTI
jgi:NAD-dependent SIR2 family protein deacetylase